MTWQDDLYTAHAKPPKPAKKKAKAAKPKGSIRQSTRQPNSVELRFEADYLLAMRLAGEIGKYRYESYSVKLGNGCSYTPDWSAINAAGTLVFWEVKAGSRRQKEAGILSLKVAASLYPEHEFYYCHWADDQWHITRVLP